MRIPSSRKKHYLTGIDWIVHGLDYMNKKATGAGNMFQIVMELDEAPREDDLRRSLERFVGKFPLVNGRLGRDYNLAPYWRVRGRRRDAGIRLEVHHPASEEEAAAILEGAANARFADGREHVVFHLVDGGAKSRVAVTFDHCLFDARGAEAFLGAFQQEWEGNGAGGWRPPEPAPAQLSEWRSKFEAGKRVNRALRRLAEGAAPRVLRTLSAPRKQGFKYGVVSFGEEQTRRIVERADSEAGYFMLMPYTLALTTQILHGLFAKRGMDGGDYLIPVSVDTRPPGETTAEIFFNHVSFLFFRIRACEVDDLSLLVKSIKEQMYDQVKAGLPQDICEASLPMRILPLPLLNYFVGAYFKGEIASFFFSFLGETAERPTRLLGKRILRSYHMTRVPVSPGLGVFFQQRHGALHAYVTYADGLLARDEVNAIMEGLGSRLGS